MKKQKSHRTSDCKTYALAHALLRFHGETGLYLAEVSTAVDCPVADIMNCYYKGFGVGEDIIINTIVIKQTNKYYI